MVTTIQISEELKDRLIALKQKPSETYEQIIARIINQQAYEYKLREYYIKYGNQELTETKAWEKLDSKATKNETWEWEENEKSSKKK